MGTFSLFCFQEYYELVVFVWALWVNKALGMSHVHAFCVSVLTIRRADNGWLFNSYDRQNLQFIVIILGCIREELLYSCFLSP